MGFDPKLQQMLLETFKEELHEIHQSLLTELLTLEKTKKKSERKEIFNHLFRFSHNLKGAARSVSLPTIATMAHHLEDLFDKWNKSDHSPTQEEINTCLRITDNFLIAFKDCEEGKEINPEMYLLNSEIGSEQKQTDTNDDYIKVPLNRVIRANTKANEFIDYRLKLEHWFNEIETTFKQLLPNNTGDVSLLTKTVNQLLSERNHFFGEFSRTTQSLLDELNSMRMLPFSILTVALKRTVRDVAQLLKKSVDFKIEGADVEIDKAVLDEIKEPLIHLVRNAIDHGIETDEERKALNKPIPALLKLSVRQGSGKILMTMSDDGRGINLHKIKQKIKEQGSTKSEIEAMDDKALLMSIFKSGMTTSDAVTEISGRGVGLETVQYHLQRIKGTIDVDSVNGCGTEFNMTFPLTLATTHGVFFSLGQHLFMLPTLAVKALFAITPENTRWVNNQLTFIHNEQSIPVLSLQAILESQTQCMFASENAYGILIGSSGTSLMVWVDAIVDEHDCVIKPVPKPFDKLPQYIGVTSTGNSPIVFVLEPKKIIEMATFHRLKLTQDHKIQTPLQKKRVLIVDDSMTTRTLCSNSLEATGYETDTAINGIQALEKLQHEQFDCVITDVVMPKMNGFELTKKIKKDKKLEHIPVIIVSLLDSKKDKEEGLKVGANAYITKNEFDTHRLLEILESLL